MPSEAVTEELEMVLAMYSDECERDGEAGLRVHLPHRLTLQITLPAIGYPEDKLPQVYVCDGLNAQVVAAFTSQLHRRMRSELDVGYPVLAPLIALAQAIAEELADAAAEAGASSNKAARPGEDDDDAAQQQDAETCAATHSPIEVWSGDPVVDRKSRFVAHLARVQSEAEVREVVAYLRGQRHIAVAAHPTIWAYRFTDDKGVMHKDCDDDGEHGASARLVFLLDQMSIDGYVVVVTRWFGGILLGPDRFKHIMEVAKNILLTIPQLPTAPTASTSRR